MTNRVRMEQNPYCIAVLRFRCRVDGSLLRRPYRVTQV